MTKEKEGMEEHELMLAHKIDMLQQDLTFYATNPDQG